MRRAGVMAACALAAWPGAAWACPFCEIGFRDAWLFMLLVVGGFIAGAALMMAWTLRTGRYPSGDAASLRVLELDRITGVRL